MSSSSSPRKSLARNSSLKNKDGENDGRKKSPLKNRLENYSITMNQLKPLSIVLKRTTTPVKVYLEEDEENVSPRKRVESLKRKAEMTPSPSSSPNKAKGGAGLSINNPSKRIRHKTPEKLNSSNGGDIDVMTELENINGKTPVSVSKNCTTVGTPKSANKGILNSALSGSYWSNIDSLPSKRIRTPTHGTIVDMESPVKGCSNDIKSGGKGRRRLSLSTTPTTIKTQTPRSSGKKVLRRTQSEIKKNLSPIIEGTATPQRGPRRKLMTEDDYEVRRQSGSITDSPKTLRRRLRAPSVTPSKNNSHLNYATPSKRSSKTTTPLKKAIITSAKKKLINVPFDDSMEDDISDDEMDVDEFKPSKKDLVSSSSSSEEEDNDEDDFVQIKKKKPRGKISKATKDKKTKEILKKKSMWIPKAHSRKVPLSENVNDIHQAQLRLHVSAVPDSLPCREDEFAEIYGFTEGKLSDGTGGCMYISGVPGTGKTATVKEVIRTLDADPDIPKFQFIEVNGMRLTDPNQAYVQIWKELNPNCGKVASEHAGNLLDRKFNSGSSTGPTIVLLVDELDMLCTSRKQNVLYNIFEWPIRPKARLIVLAIANTMDLPERVMMNRVSSRLGLTRLTFAPYTHNQLQAIVASRLEGLNVFDKDAVQLVSRKVASLSGDARRALDICRRATEIAEKQNKELVGLEHVAAAHTEMFSSPKIAAIRSCSRYEKVFLNTVVSEFHRSGIEEASFERVYTSMETLLHYDGLRKLTITESYQLINRLSASKLILTEHGSKGLQLRIRLNVSVDDVLFAITSKII